MLHQPLLVNFNLLYLTTGWQWRVIQNPVFRVVSKSYFYEPWMWSTVQYCTNICSPCLYSFFEAYVENQKLILRTLPVWRDLGFFYIDGQIVVFSATSGCHHRATRQYCRVAQNQVPCPGLTCPTAELHWSVTWQLGPRCSPGIFIQKQFCQLQFNVLKNEVLILKTFKY